MAVDYFLTDGARVVPELFAEYEAAVNARYKYFMALDLAKITHEQETECKRLAAIAKEAERTARAAFSAQLKQKS